MIISFLGSILQFASKSSDQQTSLQIVRHPQITAIKSVGLSEDQAKGIKWLQCIGLFANVAENYLVRVHAASMDM